MERNYTFTGDFSPEAVAAVLSIEMILALIANGVVLVITIYQRKSWKQSSTIFFTSLILAHLVLTLYLPFTISALAAREWIIGSTDEEKQGTCGFTGFVNLLSIYVMLMTLCLVSIDRFLFIVKPHLHKRFMTPRIALVLVIIVWSFDTAFFSSGFIDGSGVEFRYINYLGVCYAFTTSPVMAIFRFFFASLIFIIIIITSVWTFCFTRKFINNQSMIVGEGVYASKKKRLFGIFGSMMLVYGIFFTPSIFFSALLAIVDFPGVLMITAVIFFFLVITLSPVIQAYFRPEINSVIANIVCCKILKNKSYPLAISSTCNSSSAVLDIRVSSLDV
uniref:G-protein coupled receptors family 1 profile domain-containing protein n=2 Tax=Amphimedon queenslandica TaxID=400682 RepID=A0A1X7V8X2_AMPQE